MGRLWKLRITTKTKSVIFGVEELEMRAQAYGAKINNVGKFVDLRSLLPCNNDCVSKR